MVDVEPWKNNPKHNWVYNKVLLCDLQNVKWWPCPIEPTYPSIVRPIFNLSGMGGGVKKVNNLEEFKESNCYGFFSTPFIEGKHTSHDFRVVDGEFFDETIFIGYPIKKHIGAFLYWELLYKKRIPVLSDNMKRLQTKLIGYTGPLNVECIDNTIIEVHLREGDVDLLKDEYSVPLFIVPIWGTIGDNTEIDIENVKTQSGVIDVLEDSSNMAGTGLYLKRKALVITKKLPNNIHRSL